MTFKPNGDPDAWIGVDLDGTLADDTPKPYDVFEIGPPISLMVERIKLWRKMGLQVKIVTARMTDPFHPTVLIRAAIQKWLIINIGEALPVVSGKDYHMIELWDDRAVQVEHNTGRVVGYSTRGLE